jgi:inner membrane protein
MLYRTHLLFALVLFMIFILNTSLEPWIKLTFLIILVIGSKLPDIDIPESVIGKETRPVSNILSVFFGHRGFFHSLLFVILFSFVLFLLKIPYVFIIAFSLGYLSHLFLDAFTKSGINPLWPANINLKGNVKTGSLSENILFLILCVMLIVLIIKNFIVIKEIAIQLVKAIF